MKRAALRLQASWSWTARASPTTPCSRFSACARARPHRNYQYVCSRLLAMSGLSLAASHFRHRALRSERSRVYPLLMPI
ncbi:hypothetical protein B0H15DRAFT_852607 [Mycena belliarum]|uniref:Uncharacterized protein n=1 Tax=Mycena belliarum TaxID=1033014 RepID=A0AAD6TZ95_9AGAR|nr:hypothetical protein B0H15DRAFT_852607 [Mycena belliae]